MGMDTDKPDLLDVILDIPGVGTGLKWVHNKWKWFWGRSLVTPQVVFGSPVQRSKNEGESWWYIPITLERSFISKKLEYCNIILNLAGEESNLYELNWFSPDTKMYKGMVDLEPGKFFLVPIAFRKEDGDRIVYITDKYYLDNNSRNIKLEPSNSKYIFWLIVSDKNRKKQQSQPYMIRNHDMNSNSHFNVEVIYEGLGTGAKQIG